MTSKGGLVRWPLLAAAALLLSGCALPPAVTIVSFAADFASLGQTGKTVTDHGLSLMAQKDCAMLRIFSKTPICQDIPDENTPEGALVALAPIADPSVAVPADEPMILPREFAYLDGSLGVAVARRAPRADDGLAAQAFAGVRGIHDGGGAGHDDRVHLADARYLVAGMPGRAPAAQRAAAVH